MAPRGRRSYAVLNLYPYNARAPHGRSRTGTSPDYTGPHRSRRSPSCSESPRPRCAPSESVSGAHRVQHRHEPGAHRRRRHRRPPAPARGAALGWGHQLHGGRRAHAGAAPGAGATRAPCWPRPGPASPSRCGRPECWGSTPVRSWPRWSRRPSAGLARAGVTPDMVTIAGTLGAVAGAVVLFGTGHLFWGTVAVTFCVMFDMVDGAGGLVGGRRQLGLRRGARFQLRPDRRFGGVRHPGLVVRLRLRPAGAAGPSAALLCLVLGVADLRTSRPAPRAPASPATSASPSAPSG